MNKTSWCWHSKLEQTAASAFKKTKKPRGLPPPAAYEAERLSREDGLTSARVAERMGIRRSTASKYISIAREELAGR